MFYKVIDILGYEGVLYKWVFSNLMEYFVMVFYVINCLDLYWILCRDVIGFNFMISSVVGYCEWIEVCDWIF